jgi:hypothetical protein
MPAHKKPADTARSETITVRLDPKLHYLASMAAREQLRTLSSFVEWSVRRTLADAVAMADEPTPGQWPKPPLPLWEESLWDADEADRFFGLAIKRPDLLTIPEQRLWKLFNMHMSHTKHKPTVEAFREFWNDPSINTSHLKDGD